MGGSQFSDWGDGKDWEDMEACGKGNVWKCREEAPTWDFNVQVGKGKGETRSGRAGFDALTCLSKLHTFV